MNGIDQRGPVEQYIHDRDEQVKENRRDRDLEVSTYRYTEWLVKSNYTKNFTWMGFPILQYPSDLMVMQEIIEEIRPDCIIETGIAFGGMSLFYHDMLVCCCLASQVISIDIDIREQAWRVFGKDYQWKCMLPIQGDSADPKTLRKVKKAMKDFYTPIKTVLVSLDSNHTKDHVLQELRLYSPLVSVGSYIVVFDTAIEFFSHLDKNQDRPWGKGNNPYSAVMEFMKDNDEFIIDKEIEQRALITSAPSGYLRRIKEAK